MSLLRYLLPLMLLLPLPLLAQNNAMERVGDYEIYYDVLPTSFLNPQVAQGYGIVRSKGQGMVRVTVLKRLEDGSSEPVRARVSGQAGNLAGQINSLGFQLKEVGQGEGYANIASFRYSHDDPMRFLLRVTYSPQHPAYELAFVRRLLMD
ncbi:MAG: DUF4426 domain-containing protein [Marinospirillum sp.]|uniref:DUF4426 domain-containing protein n=1 Tax=Marinospirillum sp. TaxID=2183934 RepID=UPI0019FF3149|nr:DUF4426 domain-containing protein [Marinospirillum sp.]MBE0506150.1 DUF4426 domain-containing protein [Marinospirillum sp.]